MGPRSRSSNLFLLDKRREVSVMAGRLASENPPGDPVVRGNLRQQITSRILSAVFQGRFASGQRLVVQRLAELYEVSPTPLRESLVELGALGIVELLPNRGA